LAKVIVLVAVLMPGVSSHVSFLPPVHPHGVDAVSGGQEQVQEGGVSIVMLL
jgi:hypothetical protein